MKYIFGPINSRRFGISLGIDLSKDIKQCNFDCLYCELDKAKAISKQNISTNYQDIIDELKIAFIKYENIDVITLTANGEPSMYPYLDELIDAINILKSNMKIKAKTLILSNGVAVLNQETQKTLMKLDIVKLSLDAVSENIFKKINRAEKNIKIDDIIKNMINFSHKYKNQLVIEILFVKGVNDKIEEVKKIAKTLKQIKASRLDISSIDRPPAYKVEAVSQEFMSEIEKYFYFIPTTIARKKTSKTSFNYSKQDIINMIQRRPQSQIDVNSIFSNSSKLRLNELEKDGIIEKINIAGSCFYDISIVETA